MKVIVADSVGWFKLDLTLFKNLKIKIINKKSQLTLKKLETYQPDYIFFAHWNWVVSKNIYYNYKCVVFHTAPLPYGRGGSPIQNLIINGYTSSPVCALKMTEKIDAGPIYAKQNISLNGTLNDILSRINTVTNKLIHKILYSNMKPKKQKGKVRLFKRLKESDNEIKKLFSIREVYNRIRMLDHPSYPKAFFKAKGLKIELSEAKLKKSVLIAKCIIKKL